jgi:gamma-glutamylcyclotransferase (GGCT)/AIG2-like uncharacterized protein YtfP
MSQNEFVLFVYGTLKKNERASYMLAECQYLGDATTKKLYQLYSCGSFPGMVHGNNTVEGELYLINDSQKNRLDFYEGVYEGYYEFQEIQIDQIYVFGFDNYPALNNKIFAYIYTQNCDDLIPIKKWPCM